MGEGGAEVQNKKISISPPSSSFFLSKNALTAHTNLSHIVLWRSIRVQARELDAAKVQLWMRFVCGRVVSSDFNRLVMISSVDYTIILCLGAVFCLFFYFSSGAQGHKIIV